MRTSHFLNIYRSIIALAILTLFVGCGGGGGGGGGITTPSVAGTWNITEHGDADTCGDKAYTDNYTMVMTANGSQITVTDSDDPDPKTGTISGNTATFNITEEADEDGWSGTTHLVVTFSSDGKTLTAQGSWTETNGKESCAGTFILNGAKQSSTSGTTGSITGTVTYTGSQGPVSSSKPILLMLVPFPGSFDDFVSNGTTYQTAKLTTSPGTFTFTNVPAGNYQLAVGLDVSNAGVATTGDPGKIYTPGNAAGSNNNTNSANAFTITAGQLYTTSPNITFNDSMWMGQ